MLRPNLPASGARRERNAIATRARLLDAAEREFAARGFQGARLREIADIAGVQPALIHHYFTDKHGLYRAVLDRGMLPTSTESWSILGASPDLETLVTSFVELLLRFYAAHESLLAILRQEALNGSMILREVCAERATPVVEAVRTYLRERQRAGEIRADVDVDEMILATMSMVIHPLADRSLVAALLPGLTTTDEATLRRRKEAIVSILMAGIRSR